MLRIKKITSLMLCVIMLSFGVVSYASTPTSEVYEGGVSLSYVSIVPSSNGFDLPNTPPH